MKLPSKLLPVAFLVIGLLLGYFLPILLSLGSEKSVGEKVRTLYELANPGAQISVESISEMSGLYRLLLKVQSSAGTTYTETYVTRDGKLLTESIIYVENSTRSIKAFKDFVDCLYDKGLRIYGVLNQTENPQGATATYLQLNSLGRYSGKLFVDCDGSNVVNCLSANVTQVPSTVFKGQIYPGARATSFFEELTGCKLSV